MENIKVKVKEVWKHVSLYSVMILTLSIGFAVGYYYDFVKKSFKQNKNDSIKRKEVSLAIDETNNLLILKKKDGTYTVYEDSIGYMIFNLYAKNIWGNHKPQETDVK